MIDLCVSKPGIGSNGTIKTLKIPYETAEERGEFLSLDVDEKNLAGTFIPDEQPPLTTLAQDLAKAVENPIGGRKLSEILASAKKVTIITENQFRQAEVTTVVPWLLAQIKKAGATPTIVIGCGKVPVLSPEEIAKKFGREVVDTGVEIYCNDVSQQENYVYKGTTSFGVAVWVHRKVAEADAIITVSTTQATLWGYGGSGMIIPAVADNDTIEYNHVMSLAPDCLPGNNDCRIQQDKYEAARLSGISMGINMIVNNQFETTYVNAGDFIEAHLEAIKVYDKIYRFDASNFKDNKADIVITGSSAPTNHLFFHTSWAIVNCLPLVKKGGTIIFASPCPGYGDWPGFALWDIMKPYMPATPENHNRVLKSFYDKSSQLWAGCIWYKVYEAMLKADVRVVTLPSNNDFAGDIGFNVYNCVEKAYKDALAKQGAAARVAFVPYGRYTVLDV
jgi:nickel-dependent lactate racemase